MEDLLTIAIPVFNRATYFQEALDSALRQTVPVRVIVVDNASTQFDFAAVVAAQHSSRLTYNRNPTNLGMVGNWNRCIELCQTPYLIILHDDDRLATACCERLASALTEGPDIVVCRNEFIDETGRVTHTFSPEDYAKFEKLEGWCVGNPAIVGAAFRVAAARALGGFRASFVYTPDYHLWFQLALPGRFVVINEALGWYREHSDPARESVVLRRSFDAPARFYIQCKRNCRAFALRYPRRRGPIPVRNAPVYFRTVMDAQARLSDRRARYVFALYLASSAVTFRGRIARALLRCVGAPVLALARMLRVFRTSAALAIT